MGKTQKYDDHILKKIRQIQVVGKNTQRINNTSYECTYIGS